LQERTKPRNKGWGLSLEKFDLFIPLFINVQRYLYLELVRKIIDKQIDVVHILLAREIQRLEHPNIKLFRQTIVPMDTI
tara:strand:- start:1811 stop:2047 length:237 start_codon:yes stop_codon:yes gene_type:complete